MTDVDETPADAPADGDDQEAGEGTAAEPVEEGDLSDAPADPEDDGA